MTPASIKRALANTIEELANQPQLFLRNPCKDFTRQRKLGFSDIVSIVLSMEGKSITNELLDYFQCSKQTPTASALRQQRDKILPEAFDFLFREFTGACIVPQAGYQGYRLLAIDGSDLITAANPSDPDSFYPGANGQRPYNIFHLNALYDLCQHVYLDALIQKSRQANEHKALCQMVDRSAIENAILLADRGFESFNNIAHLQEKGWKFLIRIKDGGGGIGSGLDLPDSDEFDISLDLSLTRRQTNQTKPLFQQRNQYRLIRNSVVFDFLPLNPRKHDPILFYTLHLRIVRFRISESVCETVATNLDPVEFPPSSLKQLYAARWGIESSFRQLKYTVGLSAFHAKKVEHIFQETFARLTMYNFSQLVTSCIVTSYVRRKYTYRVNFSAAVHICRHFFLHDVLPLDIEALLSRLISPVRPDRTYPRKLTPKGVVSFLYKIA